MRLPYVGLVRLAQFKTIHKTRTMKFKSQIVQIMFFATVNNNYDHKQQTLKIETHKMDWNH